MSNKLITTNIIQRVLFVNYQQSVGTAFTVEKNNKQYLVSAKHVFTKLTKPDVIRIFNDNVWKDLDVKPIFCEDNSIDIIAFDLGDKKITPTHKIELGVGGINYGQDAFFLGFPYSKFTDSGQINNKYPFPFVKKAIISAIDKGVLFLDGHNNRGFSGGPVVVVKDDRTIKVIGVVSGFLTDDVNTTENSGIFYAYNIDPIIKELE